MFKRFFNNSPIKSITGAASIVALASFISRILGLFRDRVLAGQFGAGAELDTYYAAFRLPDFTYNLFILGGLSAAFIPIFTGLLHKHATKKEAFTFANTIISVGILVIIPLIILFELAAPYLMSVVVAPGFSSEQLELSVTMTRIMFLSPLLLGISGVAGHILQSFKRFFLYALAPIFYNVGIIIGALFFIQPFGLIGLAWGVVLGALLHLIIQLPGIYEVGYRFRFVPSGTYESLRRFIALGMPRSFSLVIVQLNLVVITFIASFLENGSISIFNLANNLQGFPIGIFGISFAVAAFPTLAELAHKKDRKHFSENFSKTTNQILFFVLPLTILIIGLRAQIVRVLLGTGAFDWEDTILTFNTLGFFSVSLFAQSLIPLLLRAFYAIENTVIPLGISIFSFIINILLSYTFGLYLGMGVPGLALAFSVASIIQLVVLWISLRVYFGYLNDISVLRSGVRIIFASAVMVPFIQIMKYAVAVTVETDTFLSILMQGFFTALLAIAVYTLVSWLLKSQELDVFISALKRRLLRARTNIDVGAGREI